MFTISTLNQFNYYLGGMPIAHSIPALLNSLPDPTAFPILKLAKSMSLIPEGPDSPGSLYFTWLRVVGLLTQLEGVLADLWTLLYSGQGTSFKSIN